VVLALKNPEIQFTVVDISSERIEAWNSTRIPVYEPGLFDILCRVSARHSNFIETTVGVQDTKHTIGNGSSDRDIFERKGNTAGHLASGSDGYRAPNLFFRADVQDAIAAADMVFITVNTPSKVMFS
jgi:UDPglucose 6-dehydrogenase